MDSQKFIEQFKEQFDFLEDDVVIDSKTEFKNLEDWDSLVALSVIAMADEHYDVKVSGDDIRGATIIQDLIDLISSRVK